MMHYRKHTAFLRHVTGAMHFQMLLMMTLPLAFIGTLRADDDVMAFLLQQNEAASRKIESVAYDMKWIWHKTEPDGTMSGDEMTGRARIDGDRRFAELERTIRVVDVNGHEKDERKTGRIVVNDEYAAYFRVGNPIAYMADHSNVQSMRRDVYNNIIFHAFPSPHKYGFGMSPNQNLSQLRELVSDHEKWSISKTHNDIGELVYIINRISMQGPHSGLLRGEIEINSDRGFLVTRATIYTKSGKLSRERTLVAQRIISESSETIWHPTQIEETVYETDASNSTTTTVTHIELTNIEIARDADDWDFSMNALDVSKDTSVIRYDLEGNPTAYVFYQNKLLPLETAIAIWQETYDLDRLTLDKLEMVPSIDLVKRRLNTIRDKQKSSHTATSHNSKPWLFTVVLLSFFSLAILVVYKVRWKS